MRPSARAVIPCAALVALLAAPGPQAYLKLGTNLDGRVLPVRWQQFPVRYFVTNRDAPNVSAQALADAVAAAFATWEAQPLVSLSAEFVGFTNAEPFTNDGVSVLGFRSQPELDRTLAATTFALDAGSGELRESDIFFNTAFDWTTDPGGDRTHYDVESIALHELGHLFGLSHSALGETSLNSAGERRVIAKGAVMFPIAFPPGSVPDRTLQPDDVAGIDDLYSSPASRRVLGSIGGRVLRSGAGVFGAHVMAFNPATGQSIAGFTLGTDGAFVIGGLPPGLYVVRAEPLDDADLESFFEDASLVDTGFQPAFAPRLVTVPAGGSSGNVDITVAPR
jgi:hypothetical protein